MSTDLTRADATARFAFDPDALNRAVLGSLPVQIAVLDPAGVIVSTNAAWERFARENAKLAGEPGPGRPGVGGVPCTPSGVATSDFGAGGPGGTDGAADERAAGCGVGRNYLDVCRGAGEARGDFSEEAPAVLRGITEVLEGKRREFTLEYPCHAPGSPGAPGPQRWFLLTVAPLPWPGGRRGAVVTHLNITERRRAEESLRRRAAELAHMARTLKRANEELDQFAYVTSHDLRAPLRGIANLSNWIEEDMAGRFTPEAHGQMELLRGRVHRMEAMIDGILEYSRVGRVTAPAAAVDVGELLAEAVDLLDPPAKFTVEVAAGMPIVFGEKLRLQQVFMNLISNAIKHHDKDKPVGVIRVGWRDAAEAGEAGGEPDQDSADFYEFSVADDGPGIEPQYHAKIFVIFQTLQARDKVEGTGVGLALVKKVVESQGGAIRVESEPGKGTTFRFTWPKGREQEQRGRAAGAGKSHGSERRA